MGIFCFDGFLGGVVFFLLWLPPVGKKLADGASTDTMCGAIGALSVAAAELLLPREVKNVTQLSASPGSSCFCYPGQGAELLGVVSWHQRSESYPDI